MSLVPQDWRPGWVDVMGPAAELAERIYRTEFVKGALRGRPEAVLACILAGHEVGVGPLQALAKIDVIDGKPTMSSELMRGLVLRAGHDIWVEENTTTRVTVCGRRAGREFVSKVTWTMDDAKRAGLAGKQNWQKYPRAMLLARATSELCRLMFADVLGGISYSVEELEDGGDIPPAEQPAETAPARATVKRRARQRPTPAELPPAAAVMADGPPLPGEDGYDRALGTRGEQMKARAQVVATKARRAKVDRKEAVKEATFGEKESARDLTAEEAADTLRVIDERAERELDLEEQATAAARMALSDRVANLKPDFRHTFLEVLVARGLPPRSAQMTKDQVDEAWELLDDLEAAVEAEER
jgi:hypothetical protein